MKILICVSGGIAAYKIPDLIRELTKRNHEVRVCRTQAASHFVTDLVLETLSNHKVYSSLLNGLPSEETLRSDYPIEHIALAKWAEKILVAPATAATLSKLACGSCDDLVSTVVTAHTGPVLIAPSMNTAMLNHPAVKENLEKLRGWGYEILEPDSGSLACGEEGAGRLPDLTRLVNHLEAPAPSSSPFSNKRVLITAGPTRVFIDPFRFLSNPSTGKIGFELARELSRLGAKVTLVHGPTSLKVPRSLHQVFSITTPEEMNETVTRLFPDQDVLISAAAVSDWIPLKREPAKIKKETQSELLLKFKKGPDILRNCSDLKKTGQILIGFAAESDQLEKNALKKLISKGVHAIVANTVSETQGFGDQESELSFFSINHSTPFKIGPAPKETLAKNLVHHLESWINEPIHGQISL